MAQLINFSVRNSVAVLTLANSPLNLVNIALIEELCTALEEIRQNDEVAALIVTGAGEKFFCAGSDIKEFPELRRTNNLINGKLRRENEAFRMLADFPKPTIAAVNGLAFGGGLEIVSCCDLVVSERHASFALPEITLGTFPGSGGTFRVTRRIGMGRAKQMIFFGTPISAEVALQWGLVDYLVQTGKAMDEARRLAAVLSERPKNSLAICKRLIHDSYQLDDEANVEAILRFSEEAFLHENSREGTRAFFEKRAPVFNQRDSA